MYFCKLYKEGTPTFGEETPHRAARENQNHKSERDGQTEDMREAPTWGKQSHSQSSNEQSLQQQKCRRNNSLKIFLKREKKAHKRWGSGFRV